MGDPKQERLKVDPMLEEKQQENTLGGDSLLGGFSNLQHKLESTILHSTDTVSLEDGAGVSGLGQGQGMGEGRGGGGGGQPASAKLVTQGVSTHSLHTPALLNHIIGGEWHKE